MKKKRFMKLLALASCVTLLTGCESEAFFGLGKYWNQFADWGSGLLEKIGLKKAEQKDEKESEDKPSGGEQGGEEQGGEGGGVTPEPTKAITVAELPEKLDCIESIDLDDYVTLEGLESYEVALDANSEELAELEGHVITTLDEGTISFTVSAGELSKKCSFECVSSTREFLYDAFSEAGNRYTVLSYDYDDQDNLIIDDYFVHSDLYIMTKYFTQDANQNVIPGGWLSFEGEDLYQFTIEEDATTQEEQVVLGAQASGVYFNVYNPVIEADYYFETNGTFEYDEQYDEKLIVLEGDACMFFAQEALMAYQGQIQTSTATYEFTKIQFTLNEYEDDQTGEVEQFLVWYAYISPTTSDDVYLYGFGEILFGDDAGDELLDAYCIPENKPAGVDYWNYFHPQLGLGDFFVSNESLYLPATGLYSIEYGWTDDNGDPIDCPATGNFSYMPVGSKLMFLSGSSIWDVQAQYDETTGDLVGYAPTYGKMEVEGEGGAKTVYDIYTKQGGGYTAIEAEETSAWGNGDLVFAGLRDHANYPAGCFASVEDVYVTVPGENEGDPDTEEYDHTVFTFQPGKVTSLLYELVDGDDGLYYLGAIMDLYGSNITNYFYGELTIYRDYGVAVLHVSLGWDDNQNWELTFTSQYSSDAASQAASFEAYMTANVIGQ